MIVGTLVEPRDGGIEAGIRRQHDHGHHVAAAPQAPEHFEPVDPRQGEIEDHHGVVGDPRAVLGLGAVVGHVNRVAAAAQDLGEPAGDVAVALHQQQPHRPPSPPGLARPGWGASADAPLWSPGPGERKR